jgi:RND family efflux transporter MFP subunit
MLVQKNNGRVLITLALVLIVLAAIGFFALQQFRPTARVKAVNRQEAADAVTGTVTIDAQGGTRDFKSEAPGKVIWCEALKQTAMFKKDDKLLELDSTDIKRQMEDARRAFAHASQLKKFELTGGKPELLDNAADLSEANRVEKFRELNPARKLVARRLETAERLLKLNSVSQEDVRTLERELENIDNTLKRTVLEDKKNEADFQSSMDALNVQLKRMVIHAPSDGQIDVPQTWEGALIGQGQVVATWFSNERVVAAKISEESFGKVKLGQKARLRLLTSGREEFDAVVSKLHPKADDAQRFTVFLDVKVDHPEEALNPNSTGEVTITIDTHKNALMIPRRAVFDSDKVFVVKDGRAEKRAVQIGFVSLNLVEILAGLKEGEQVIVDNLDEFRDGQRVQVDVMK